MSSYRLMDAEKATYDKAGSDGPGFEIARMAALLQVSRSGYYAWQRRKQAGPTRRQQRRTTLTAKINKFHADSDHVYGSPRILADLRDDGETVSRKTVAKLMRSNGIVGISPRSWTPVTTWPDLGATALPDLVGRRFDQGELNKVWTSDIERHEAFANPGDGGRPSRDACRSRRLEAGGRSTASAWGWLVEQSSTTTSRSSTARWGGLG